jgi:hypothetical protein
MGLVAVSQADLLLTIERQSFESLPVTMDFQKRNALSWGLLLFAVLPSLVAGIAVDICSGFNTATMAGSTFTYLLHCGC